MNKTALIRSILSLLLAVILTGSLSIISSCSGGGGGGGDGGTPQPHPNVAFVTSVAYPGNLGGIAGADAKCQSRADAAGLPGTFKAWISDSTTDAYCHIHNLTGKKATNCGGLAALPVAAGPWIKTNGAPFAPTIDKLTASPHVVYTPLNYDEFGNLFLPTWAGNYTNTDWNGVYFSGYAACNDWTDGTVSTEAVGGQVYSAANNLWGSGFGYSCASSLPLICMQTGAGMPLSSVTTTGKTVFITSTAQSGNLGGLAGADAICQSRASAGGLANPTKFRAWLSDSTTDAISRLSSNGPWVRRDGIKVADNKAVLTSGTLFTSISLNELGDYVNSGAWTGTNANGTKAADTCNNWTDNTAGNQGLIGIEYLASSDWSSDSAGAFNCNNTYNLYCFEDN